MAIILLVYLRRLNSALNWTCDRGLNTATGNSTQTSNQKFLHSLHQKARTSNIFTEAKEQIAELRSLLNDGPNGTELAELAELLTTTTITTDQLTLYAEQVKSLLHQGWRTHGLARTFATMLREKLPPEQLTKQFSLYTEQIFLFKANLQPDTNSFTEDFIAMLKEKPTTKEFNIYAKQVKSFIHKNYTTDNLTMAFTAMLKEKPSPKQLRQQFNLYAQQLKLFKANGWDTYFFTRDFIAMLKEKPTPEELNIYPKQIKFLLRQSWGGDSLTSLTEILSTLTRMNLAKPVLNRIIDTYEQIVELNNPQYGNHEERQVSTTNWLPLNAKAITNLEIIAKPVHDFLISNLQDRKNPALYTEEIAVFRNISDQSRKVLKDFYQSKKQELFSNDQRFLLRLARFVKILSDLKSPISLDDLKNNSASKEELVRFLGKKLLKTFSESLDIKIPDNVNIDKFLESWDLEHLGTLLNTSSRWDDKDQSIFKTLISSAITGNLASTFSSEINETASDSNIIIIQKAFQNFKTTMTKYGLNNEAWINAHKTSSLVNASADSNVDVEKTFSEKLRSFREYINQQQRLDTELQEQWNTVNSGGFTKEALKTFIKALIKKNYAHQNLPEEIADMQNLLNNKDDKRKYQTISFADPLDLGHNLFAGNRANSCTALDSNAQAIFYLSCDPGTKYIHVKNSSSNITGYARIFLALDDSNKPKVFIDSIDGSGHNFEKSIVAYTQEFAKNIGLTENDVINRIRDKETTILIEKLGGSPFPDKYFHHAGEQMAI